MSTVGQIIEKHQDGKTIRTGYIKTLEVDLTFELKPNTASTSPMSPDYVILMMNSRGAGAQVGAAWRRTIDKPEKDPFEMMSITIDDPSFPHPLNVAAFQRDDGNWDISFRRRQNKVA